MKGKRSLNPVQDEARKRKKKEQAKLRQERSQRRDAKLSTKNVFFLEKKIFELKDIEKSRPLNSSERQQLDTLERDVYVMKKKGIGGHSIGNIESEKTKHVNRERRQKKPFIPKNPKKSVYYHPIFNPYGVPPPGMPYKEIDDDNSESSETDESVINIPMPEDEFPGDNPHHEDTKRTALVEHNDVWKQQEITADAIVKTEYSAEPIVRDLRKEAAQFIPASLKRQPQQLEEPNADSELEKYYSELNNLGASDSNPSHDK
ncbi:ww domain binding protein 11 [Schizosaccharomyces japonicus yFS275]|uniref:Ww domain binding protein 11 n=1 Tax=Schizosaccharomyces japonicus (strain yFS275 / FY16936) TaxID=402676 RepID=B6JVF3_SCHJY|nr:ww domain binding protein 11 [Schizosaccharomyces japonicus yFS275]EEB05354.1 ww domain binding protein 11 [Schizosaccharomyces japonicus yFS275]